MSENSVSTCLWFEKGGLEAAKFYVDLVPNSAIISQVDGENEPLVVEFTLGGAPYMILSGGPHFKLSPACSISVRTPDQAESDRLWYALTTNGGEEGQCGWLVDRFGVSWQVYPRALIDLFSSKDREAAGRATAAMMKMKRIDINEMQRAFDGE